MHPYYDNAYRILSGKLHNEAHALWRQARLDDSPHTVSAIVLFCLTCFMLGGEDDLGRSCAQEGRAMAARLNMFGSSNPSSQVPLISHEESAHGQAAWGFFSLSLMFSLYFGDSFELTLPNVAIPEDSVNKSFPALARLQCIHREVQVVYGDILANGRRLLEAVPFHFVQEKYLQFMAWAQNLESLCTRDNHAAHQVLNMQ